MFKSPRVNLIIIVLFLITSSINAETYIALDGPVSEVFEGPFVEFGEENTIYWANPSIQWYLDPSGAGDGITFSDTYSAVAAACAEWASVSTATASFSYIGTYSVWGEDNKNVHYWAESNDSAYDEGMPLEDNPKAITVISINSSNQIVDVDILYNGDGVSWNTDGTYVDVQAIATHEIGHMLGLGHESDHIGPYSTVPTMYPNPSSSYPTVWRSLETDDEIGVSFTCGGNIITSRSLEFYSDYYFNWDVNINPSVTLTLNSSSNLYVAASKDITVEGTLVLCNNTVITKMSGSDWGNIEVESGGELNITGNATIEYSNNYAVDVSSGGTLDIDGELTIQDSYQGIDIGYNADIEKEYSDQLILSDLDGVGLRLYSNYDTIRNVTISNSGQGLRAIGSSGNPNLQYFSIGLQDSWGILVDDNCDATLSYSIIGPSQTGTYPYNIWLDSGADIQIYMGENDFYPGSGAAIYMASDSDDVYAGGNYWGSASPVWTNIFNYYPSKVTIGYYYQTPRNNGAYKPALNSVQDDVPPALAQLREALAYENSAHWSAAGTIYREVLSSTDNPTFRRKALKALLRVINKSTQDYTEFRKLVQNELNICPKYQKALYDNLLCELYALDGKYRDAIYAYEDILSKYNGTETGVDILTHLAVLSGDVLGDKVKAKEYADRAAAINPGQMTLEFAYEAAGMIYEPTEYIDVFKTKQVLSEEPDIPEDEAAEAVTEFIGNSPNPFNPATTFTFAIGDAGHVTLDVYSIAGQKVATLIDNTLSAGTHSAVFDGSGLGSGMYFYRFQSPGLTKNGKMLLVK